MTDHKQSYPIAKMAKLFGVSRSGYYRWLGSGPSKRTLENQRLRQAIAEAWDASGHRYGSPRIHRQLIGEGWQVSRPRVARLMKAMGIQSQIRRKWVTTTDSRHRFPVAPNLLDRRFTASQLGQVWVSDITYLSSKEGWLYLTTVMDLADRQILGWSLSEGINAEETAIEAFNQAVATRRPNQELLFHSDQGVQYACREFTKLLDKWQITQSMSRKGNCWDNAPAESFFKTLKAELGLDGKFASYQQARMTIFEFIELWYNRRRLHSALGYRTPAQTEQFLLNQNQAA
ncbi:IS3 family transposase [Halalkalibaculum sp. DA3122]|uniref:IS3 family transposase n=1 Tax=Halalkalibaculum sp. DA3122 TaxID=3373607 RepID=UPI003754572A